MANHFYSLFKGHLKFGVPYLRGYNGNPHYVIVLDNPQGGEFKIVTNVKSDTPPPNLLYLWDQFFQHPMVPELDALSPGLHEDGFPLLDFVHDARLLDLHRMRPIALDTEHEVNDINDLVNRMLHLDTNSPAIDYIYHGSRGADHRKGWRPTVDVIVYGFGFLFQPNHEGLHETHMNQGNPPHPPSPQRDHSAENGTHQDGAVIIQVGDKFQALFTAFQSQFIPTDNRGYPIPGAKRILG